MSKRIIGPVTKAAVSGGGLAGSITVVCVWVASINGLEVPELVAGAFTVIIGAAGAALSGWAVHPGDGDHVQ